jgi:hypothetical protein
MGAETKYIHIAFSAKINSNSELWIIADMQKYLLNNCL